MGNRSQFCKVAAVMMFLVQIDYFGTYDVELSLLKQIFLAKCAFARRFKRLTVEQIF